MATKRKPKKDAVPKSILQKLSLFFFKRPRTTAILWLVIATFGIASYTTLLKREGFPSIETPFALAQGAYLVNDPAKVDNDVAKPLSEFLMKQSGVKQVQMQSFDNFYSGAVSFEEGVDAVSRSNELQKQITEQKLLPEQATYKLEAFKFGFTMRGDDLVVSFYSDNSSLTTKQLADKARGAAAAIKAQNLPLVNDVSIIEPYETATNPATGQQQESQKTFDRFGIRENNQNNFYNSVVIGVDAKDNVDQLELDKQIREAISKVEADGNFAGYNLEISGSNAPQINEQINELQRTLLEGLIAVLIVGSIVIAVRASIITVLSMVTVLATVNGVLLLIGESLNTITLFSLILGLSLIVDDTIIMVEALDAQRKRLRNAEEAVRVATGKVARAMIAATLTAALSFTPLLFVSGILGSFIRAIPITIISALLISLLVSLIFIPFFARFILLRKKQMGEENVHEIAAGVESKIAQIITAPMLWARNSRKKLFAVGITAIVIGFGFIGTGLYLFQKVTFNIFPSSKDANMLSVTVRYSPGTNIDEAQKIADDANKIVGDVVSTEFVKASNFNQTGTEQVILQVDITDYKKRGIKAPEIVNQLNDRFANFNQAKVEATQIDAGPPASSFMARVDSIKNREGAARLANDIGKFLSEDAELKRPDGSVAEIKSVSLPNTSVYNREDGKPYLQVSASFKDNDTTTLVTLAKEAVEKEFPKERVASYGLNDDALDFSFGQEDENQDSFKTLAIAFPVVLAVIYVLLSIQFRSLLQPLLIFMAIPFSLFGITLGLYLTDNAFSFFAMLGFFALIGLSIKNTILLTDYANQARNAGMNAIDAVHEALAERFRPLIATSLTAVVSLIPLAVTSPFWEGLAVVLIFGLLSSTFLVITVFPYYYLGSEFLRSHFSRKTVLLWLTASIILIVILSRAKFGSFVLLVPFVTAFLLWILKKRRLI